MSGAWQAPRGGDAGFLANFGAAWVQDNFAVRGVADGVERLNRWGAAMRPAPVEGYSPFADAAALAGFENSLSLFRDSQSPEETRFIMERIRGMRERAAGLDQDGAFLSRFLAAAADPVNLLLPGVAGVGGGALRTAGRFAVAGAAMQVPYSLMDQAQLPGDLQSSMLLEVALAGLLGGALGGAAGAISRRSLDAAARRHADIHDAYDRLRTPDPMRAPAPEPQTMVAGISLPRRDAAPTARAANDDMRMEVVDETGAWWRGPNPMADELARMSDERIAFWREIADAETWPTLRLIDARDRDDLFPDLIARELERRGLVTDSAGRYVERGDLPQRSANENEPGDFRLADDFDLAPGPSPRPLADIGAAAQPPTPTPSARVVPAAAEPAAGAAGTSPPPAPADRAGDDLTIPPPPPRGPGANDNTPGDAPGSAVDVNRVSGLPNLLGSTSQLPYWRLKANRFAGALREGLSGLADEIVQTPISGRAGNEAGRATLAESVEAGARQWMARYHEASEATFEAYAKYRGWSGAWAGQFTGRLRTMAEAVPGVKQGQELSFPAFREEIFRALHAGSHQIPEVAEAARVWRDRVFEPIAEEGAKAGVLLLRKYREEARGAIQREIDGRARRLREAKEFRYDLAGYTDPEVRKALDREIAGYLGDRDFAEITIRDFTKKVEEQGPDYRGGFGPEALTNAEMLQKATDDRDGAIANITAFNERLDKAASATPVGAKFVEEFRDMREAQAGAKGRMKLLADLKDRGAYLPHVHNHRAWREAGNEAVERVGRHFAEQQAEVTWASPMVRAELAVAHILGESVPDMAARVVRRTLMDSGMDFTQAAAKAAEMTGGIRARAEAMGPARMAVEMRSLLGQKGERISNAPLLEPLRKVLDDAGVRSNDDDRLLRELLNIGTARNLEDMAVQARSATMDAELGDFARPGHARERKMQVPTALIADLLDRDIMAVGLNYTRNMAAAIEMGRKFGDPSMLGRLERLALDTAREVHAGRAALDERDATLRATRDLRDKVLGHFGMPEDPSAWSVRGAQFLQHFAIVTQMGGALLSNVMDTGRIIMAQGVRRTLGAGLDELARNPIWKGAADEALKAGAAVELSTLQVNRAAADVRDVGADRLWVERAMGQAVPAMFVLNLVAPWTQMMQRVAGGMIQSDMIELSRAVATGRASAADRTRLALLGVDEREAAKIHEAWQAAGGQSHGRLLLANTDEWADVDLRNRFRARLVTAIDQAVTKPGAADLPNFMSAPAARMLLLYRGFAMSFAQRAIMAGIQQRDGLVLSGALATIAIAYMTAPSSPVPQSFVNWDRIEGDDTKRAREQHIVDTGRLYNAIERSGMLSLFGDLNRMVEVSSGNAFGIRPLLGMQPPAYARDPNWGQRVGEIGGPAISPWAQALWAFTSEDAKGSQVAGAMRRLLPFNNLIWWDSMFRALGTEAGAAIGDPDRSQPGAPNLPGFAGGR
jgi:hypothetical protein